MKKITLLFALAFALVSAAWSQTSLTATTLGGAITSTSTRTVVLASATGVTAGQTVLFVDHEAMFVNSVNSTTLSVFRGYGGTPVTTHLTGQGVLLGPPNAFNPIPTGVNAAGDPSGSCTASATLYTPFVNIKNGNQWLCSTVTNSWVPGWHNVSVPAGVTTTVASASGAQTLSGPLLHISGTNTITSFTVPLGFDVKRGGGFCIIPDGVYHTTAGNNVGTTTTAVANTVQCWTFDVNAAKFFSSY